MQSIKSSLQMKPVKGFEGRYSATSNGDVFSHLSKLTLKAKKQNSGYLEVALCRSDGKIEYKLIHRIVCEAFNGEHPDQKMFVNHIDGDKTNNRPENLEWCSRSENMRHAFDTGLMKNQISAVKKSNMRRSKPVIGTMPDGSTIRFDSVTEARRSGFSKVSECLLGNRKTSGGATWRYA